MFIFQSVIQAEKEKKKASLPLDTIPRPTVQMNKDKQAKIATGSTAKSDSALRAIQDYYNRKMQENMVHIKDILRQATKTVDRMDTHKFDEAMLKVENALKTKYPSAAKNLHENILNGTIGGYYDLDHPLKSRVIKSGDDYVIRFFDLSSKEKAEYVVTFKPVPTEKGIEIVSLKHEKASTN